MTDERFTAKLRATTPVFQVDDIASTMRWYQANLGFDGTAYPESPPHAFCILRKDDVEIFLQQLDGYQKPDHRDSGVADVHN